MTPIDFFSVTNPVFNLYNRGTNTVALATVTATPRITGSTIARQVNLSALADGEYDMISELPTPGSFALIVSGGSVAVSDSWAYSTSAVETELVTLTIKDSGGIAIAGAEAYITSDIGGTTVVVEGLVSNSVGKIFFRVPAGTYYCWASHPTKTFTNPTTLAVSDA